ncbi:YkvA family protein [Bacteroides finegoldii]|uniref:YkvA family protein n=1 Tax=Bacteroides finegoldii TaxID=338188 RepID=UPI00189E1E15|nr:YkvA family protein [Bacteroides finegoldii]
MGAKTIAIGALLYAVSPIDALPDIVPILGLTDDAAVITAAVTALGSALNKYKQTH